MMTRAAAFGGFSASRPALHRRVAGVLFAQLAPTGKTLNVEPTFARGCQHSAAWLFCVCAIAELTRWRKFGNLSEQRLDTAVSVAHMQRTNSRRVDDPPPTLYRMDRPGGRRMASFGIVFANGAGLLG